MINGTMRGLGGMMVLWCALGCALGCGGGGGGSVPQVPTPAPLSGVRGVTREVIEGGAIPLTPRPPFIEPLPNVVVIVQQAGGGREFGRQRSDANGRFEFALRPGTYLMLPRAPAANNGLLPAPRQTVVVRPGRFTNVTVDYLLLAP